MNEIIPNLWLGNFAEACKHQEEFDVIFCVMDICELDKHDRDEYFTVKRPIIICAHFMKYDYEMRDTKWGPQKFCTDVYADPIKLNFTITLLKTSLSEGKKCLVHCAAAEERSPLTVIFHLWKNHLNWKSIEEVYQFVKKKHPPTLDRLEWLKRCLPEYYNLNEEISH